jgi:hypothetical protein
MKRILKLATLSVSALAIGTATAAADYTLHIVHINDMHSRIEPINRFDSTCSAEDNEAGECFGGVARVATKINELRSELEGQNVLVLDAGDQYQGSLFYTTYKGDAEAEFMKYIGFDAMAVGNHEFDDGDEGLAKLVDKVEFPVISGNVDVEPVGGARRQGRGSSWCSRSAARRSASCRRWRPTRPRRQPVDAVGLRRRNRKPAGRCRRACGGRRDQDHRADPCRRDQGHGNRRSRPGLDASWAGIRTRNFPTPKKARWPTRPWSATCRWCRPMPIPNMSVT